MNTTGISKKEIKAVKDSLLQQKALILNKSNEFRRERGSSFEGGDEAEAVSEIINTSISIHLHERDRLALVEIEKALGRISEGSYNECESCGDNIGLKRLKARPFTTLCISCMEEQEDHKNLFSQ